MTDSNKKMITREVTAQRVGVSIRTVDRWLAQRRLTKYRDGVGGVWIDPDELDRLTTPQPVDAAVR